MRRFWRRSDELEARLRSHGRSPRPEFMSALLDRVESSRARRGSLRVVFVGALTSVFLIALAAFGGLGYASSAAKQVGHAAKIVIVGKSVTATMSQRVVQHKSEKNHGDDNDDDDDDNDNGDDDQYRPGKGCGDKNHVHSRHNECKDKHDHGHGGHGHGHGGD